MRRSRWLMTALMCVMSLAMWRARGAELAQGVDRVIEELSARLSAAESKLPADRLTGPGEVAKARLALLRLRYVLPADLNPDPAAFYAAADAAERQIELVERGGREDAAPRGVVERAYISEVDGSAQPYLIYVPASYNPERAWPLAVFLHGYNPLLSVMSWDAAACSTILQEIGERAGAILLLPFGRSNTEFMGIGEKDVLDTIGFVQAEYRIDPGRVVLVGMSMGGSGACSIACHYPDQFAGLVVLTGRIDYYLWMGVAKESLPRFKQVQMDADYARELIPNLSHMPVRIYHGAADTAVQVEQSRLLRDLLTAQGQEVFYREVAEADHLSLGGPEFLGDPGMTEMIASVRRPERPARVSYRTLTLKYPGAYWVRIEEMGQWGRMAEIVAEAEGDNIIRVRSDNVVRFTLGPDLPGGMDPGIVKLVVNGAPVEGAVRDGRLWVGGDGRTEGTRKSAAVCGPIREAFSSPFVIVYPTSTDPAAEQDRANASRLAREWILYAQGVPAMLPDHAVAETVIKERNLVLCGSPQTNTVLARIADRLPFEISAEQYRIGAHSFPTGGSGFQGIYPNPENPDRYVLIVHGAPWGTMLQRNHKLDFLPDFIVYTSETEADKTLFPTNRWLCAGYFDGGWRVSEDSLWLRDTDLRHPAPADRLSTIPDKR